MKWQIILLTVALMLTACTQTTHKTTVAVTIEPLAGIVEAIAGDNVDILTMVPAGASPHTYEPLPSQMSKLAQTDVYIKAGTPIEFEINWLDSLLSINKGIKVIDASSGIKLILEHKGKDFIFEQSEGLLTYKGCVQLPSPCHQIVTEVITKDDEVEIKISSEQQGMCAQVIHNRYIEGTVNVEHASEVTVYVDGSPVHKQNLHLADPHIWLSPKNVKVMAQNIHAGLLEIMPEKKTIFDSRLDVFLREIDSVDAKLMNIKTKEMIVYHDSWKYLARDYNITQIAIEHEGKEPSAKDIQKIIEYAKLHYVKTIFVSPQFNTQSAQVIAQEIGGEIVYIDPLRRDLIANFEDLAQKLS